MQTTPAMQHETVRGDGEGQTIAEGYDWENMSLHYSCSLLYLSLQKLVFLKPGASTRSIPGREPIG